MSLDEYLGRVAKPGYDYGRIFNTDTFYYKEYTPDGKLLLTVEFEFSGDILGVTLENCSILGAVHIMSHFLKPAQLNLLQDRVDECLVLIKAKIDN